MTTLEFLVMEQERELRFRFRKMSQIDIKTHLSDYIKAGEEIIYLFQAHINYLRNKEKFG
jgi:hypothetical protein